MKVGPRYKVCRRLGSGVFEKCQSQAYMLSEAKHAKSARRGRAPSDYGKQLLEKQRIRLAYGVPERQLRRYIAQANHRAKGVTPADCLAQLLESRLDNVVFRAGLAPTRRMARQLVAHGHITVGDRRVTIPSYEVKKGERVAVREASREKPVFAGAHERIAQAQAPSWLTFDAHALAGDIAATPQIDTSERVADFNAVLEFYSR